MTNEVQREVRKACPVCNGKHIDRYCERGEYHLVRCRDCSLIFVREIVPDSLLDAHYHGQSCDCYVEQDTELREKCHKTLDHIEELGIPGRRVLDVGCGSGLFLETARDRKFEVHGIEADTDRVQWCRGRGLDVIHGQFPDPRLEPESYDVVWTSHVIEHVQHPMEFIGEIEKLLKLDGLLSVLTPNAKCLSFKITRCHHRYVMPPEHLLYWNARSLESATNSNGLVAERIFSRGGELQLKEVLAYVLRRQFLRPPSAMPSEVRFVEGKGEAASLLYRALLAVSRRAGPIMEKLGGDELVGFFRKHEGGATVPVKPSSRRHSSSTGDACRAIVNSDRDIAPVN